MSTTSRTLSVESAAIPIVLGRPALEPVRLSGREGVNSLFEYELLLKTPDPLNLGASGAADWDLDSFIGREITCSIQLDGAGPFIPGAVGASVDQRWLPRHRAQHRDRCHRQCSHYGRLLQRLHAPEQHCELSQDQGTVGCRRPHLPQGRTGSPGRIYDHTGQVHFEICCDEDNLQRLTHRGPDWADPESPQAPTRDGRTDSVFGDTIVYLPAGTPTSATAPTGHLSAATGSKLKAEQWVAVRYDKGSATLRSYDERGEPLGAEGGHREPDFEYNLYTEATRRHNSLDKAGQAASSPSGWFELLRFGRNLGPDPLPANAAHWREIPTASGTVWADLNAPGSFKFSDADFLPAMGWNCFDDDSTPNDQRCDSLRMKTLIRERDPGDQRRMERDQLARRLGQAAVRAKLRRTICKFPSEWDRGSIEARHAWLKMEVFNDAKAENWERFVRHLNAISFEHLPAAFLKADWRFHPREFVGHMRQCGWLSLGELASTFPKHMFYTEKGSPRTAISANNSIYTLTKNDAQSRVERFKNPLNFTIRKYIGGDKKRIGIFLSQVLLETAQWRDLRGARRLMHEWGFGSYSPNNPATQYYTAFYGRGTMQLTWAGNYREYGSFRKLKNHNGQYIERLTPKSPRITATSRHYSANPKDQGQEFFWYPRYDPDLIGEDPYASCDSGGAYWVSKSFSEGININRVSDRSYSSANIGFINKLVNGGSNGYYERQAYTCFMFQFLMDRPNNHSLTVLISTAGKSDIQVDLQRAK
jgi:predicted chitinase